jgi:hypothetical protein
MSDENDWSAVLFPLVNDQLAGLLSWEEFQEEVAQEAKRLGYKLEPLAADERNTTCKTPTRPLWLTGSGASSSQAQTSSKFEPSKVSQDHESGGSGPSQNSTSDQKSRLPTQQDLTFTKG